MKLKLIERRGESVQLLLACGHFSEQVDSKSSVFDFPEEPMLCWKCRAERQMDVRLQHALHAVQRNLGNV